MTLITLIILVVCFSANNCFAMEEPPAKLFSFLDDDPNGIPECQEEDILSCRKVQVHMNHFKALKNLEFPGQVVLHHASTTKGQRGSYANTYESLEGEDFADAIITFSNFSGFEALDGHLNLPPNVSYVLENCGEDCHVLIEEPFEKEHPDNPEYEEDDLPQNRTMSPRLMQYLGEDRQNEMVDVSVIIYYTPQFRQTTSNLESYFNNEVMVTNQGYAQSNVQVNLVIHCIQEIDLNEPRDTRDRLNQFRNAKGSVDNLLNSADIAIMFTATTATLGNRGICGQASTINVPRSNGAPVGWAGKNCFLTFSHEIGHLFGARHNRESDDNDRFVNFAHGWRVPNQRFYTIMSTRGSATGHVQRINFYSNTVLRINNQPMGDPRSDNRRLLNMNRGEMSQIGNEQRSCDANPSQCSNVLETSDCNCRAKRGECTSNQQFMETNCRLSCGLCCGDAFTQCAEWANQGICTRCVRFMSLFCVRSCTQCS